MNLGPRQAKIFYREGDYQRSERQGFVNILQAEPEDLDLLG